MTKGDYVYLVCSAANARPRTCHYEALPYDDAERTLINAVQRMIDEAPRGNDTTALDRQIASAEAESDMLMSEVQDLLAISIEEKSVIARRNLKQREQDLANTEDCLRELRERRDTLASTGVLRRLEAIERTLSATPLDRHAANKVLREAMERMVIFAAEGRADIYWRHASEPQEAVLMTSKFEWGRAL